jgi:hypothetical protein
VQTESGVLQILEALPGFATAVPQPELKEQLLLQAYTRSVYYWDLNCDWASYGMTRKVAMTYYA